VQSDVQQQKAAGHVQSAAAAVRGGQTAAGRDRPGHANRPRGGLPQRVPHGRGRLQPLLQRQSHQHQSINIFIFFHQ